jgi:hypothetical protein
MGELLADSALPGESLAATGARIEADANNDGNWTPEKESLLTQLLGGTSGPDIGPPASSTTLVRRKLANAAKVAAPRPAIPPPQLENAPSSAGANWPTSPGSAERR